MLWNISIIILLTFWLLGIVGGYTAVYFTHLPLFFAIIAILIKIEDECSGYGSIEKISPTIISPQTYREE